MVAGWGPEWVMMGGERPGKSAFECLWKTLEGEMGAGGRYLRESEIGLYLLAGDLLLGEGCG